MGIAGLGEGSSTTQRPRRVIAGAVPGSAQQSAAPQTRRHPRSVRARRTRIGTSPRHCVSRETCAVHASPCRAAPFLREKGSSAQIRATPDELEAARARRACARARQRATIQRAKVGVGSDGREGRLWSEDGARVASLSVADLAAQGVQGKSKFGNGSLRLVGQDGQREGG